MNVTIAAGSESLSGYLSTPPGAGPWPAVLVVHEAFGLNDDIRGIADRFAAEGYVALAPDLFSWASTPRCLVSTFRDLLRRQGPTHQRIDAARDWLAAHDACNGSVAVIGFCMGGGFALLAAPRPGYTAASVNYGLVPKDAERLLAGACPIVASYGARDRALRGHAGRLERALAANGVPHDVQEYAGVSHSFLNRHPGWMSAFDRISGFGYGATEAEAAWGRIFQFFDHHLRAGSA
ncbi:MAG TPA: dienelactone hydrolase family protein [Acidimicrobiia bacterium]|nr:dienelactone hydrolase family protein [Acidimicrobiia bacterium]